MRRLSVDATEDRCAVGRAVRCSCDAVIRPRAQSSTTTFFLTARVCRKKKSTQSTKYMAVTSMWHLYPAKSPPHDFAGLRGRVALAWPRRKGHAFDEVRVAWCGANHLPCDVRTYVTQMMLVSCCSFARVNSGSSGQQDSCFTPNPKNQTRTQLFYDDMGIFVRFMKLFFGS